MTMPRIRSRLDAARQAQGLTFRELGRKAGISDSTVRDLLRADRRYTRREGQPLDDPRVWRTITSMATALGIAPATLRPAPVDERLGAALKAARLARGHSQEWVAGVVGLHQTTLYDIESNPDYYTTPELSDALAAYLQVPLRRTVDPATEATDPAPCRECAGPVEAERRWCPRCGAPNPRRPRKEIAGDDNNHG